jgi:transposase
MKHINLNLTPFESEILRDYLYKSKNKLIQQRALAIWLYNSGDPIDKIIYLSQLKERTITELVKKFSRQRISSIVTKYKSNHNASKLTREQRAEIMKVLKSPPSDYGLPRKFWTVQLLRSFTNIHYSVEYESDRSYHHLLKIANLEYKLPDKLDKRRDNAGVEKRIAEIREEIKPLMNNPDWVVLASDESRLECESEVHRAWIPVGKKTILEVDRSNQFQNFIGFLDLKTGRHKLLKLTWQNQETIIEALRKLSKAYAGKKICIVWDNAPWHKGKLIRKALSKGGELEGIHFISFPPYAPDKNPEELVWKYIKTELFNYEDTSFDETVNRFIKIGRSRLFEYKI